jgi:ribonucleoside-diphosphate reductase alpha chain
LEQIAREGTIDHIDGIPEDIKNTFRCAHDITPEWHIRMQAAFQRHCDASISKTTNFPTEATQEQVREVYIQAYDAGLKGVTVYRDGCRNNQPMALNNNKSVKSDDPRLKELKAKASFAQA